MNAFVEGLEIADAEVLHLRWIVEGLQPGQTKEGRGGPLSNSYFAMEIFTSNPI